MAHQQDHDQGDPVVAAIERVLSVEHDGVEQLRHGREHAERLLAQARSQAEAIARRADVRISNMHSSYLQKLQRDIDNLAQSGVSAGEQVGNTYDRARLVQAARRVAAKLTGGA